MRGVLRYGYGSLVLKAGVCVFEVLQLAVLIKLEETLLLGAVPVFLAEVTLEDDGVFVSERVEADSVGASDVAETLPFHFLFLVKLLTFVWQILVYELS